MSTRTLRLCDHVSSSNGGVCNGEHVDTCPLCKRDCCSWHLASSKIGAVVTLFNPEDRASERATFALGSTEARVCRECQGRLLEVGVGGVKVPSAALPVNVSALTPELLVVLSAFLSEKALKETE